MPIDNDRTEVTAKIKQKTKNKNLKRKWSLPKTTIEDPEHICNLKPELTIQQLIAQLTTESSKKSNTKPETSHGRGRQHRNPRLQVKLWPIIQFNNLTFQQSQPIINKLLQGKLNTMRYNSKRNINKAG